MLANGVSRTATDASAFETASSFQAPSTRMHGGVDWSHVAAASVDTGATVGAYDR